MENMIILKTCTYAHQAHIIAGYLESEGIETNITDELTAHITDVFSNTVGGVKIWVKESDYE